ncbi:SLC13 family permease [Kutzneria buriramensis]|uniref:Na+/H+ antiporter NhaD/arsenite permease-like protein n=1 Tax=Kutzneria buriramensis TaxID=1045776 RepID=A0A3E0I668_9PSEU|nr:SLC13 family permease [Kutzneria buriramensis]REH54219.1 Na+/H+ antiporter NhaD/arsenite permease-like protein [Kutzneria buriramensis]
MRLRLDALDWVALGLLAVGLVFLGSGLLPVEQAQATMVRIGPILVFLGAVIVLAELTAEAGVFDTIAIRLTILARGDFVLLFVLCVLFAAITTATLNLDTTAVLLTPVMLAVAKKLDIPGPPLAMTTVWLANTASLLLPVSNLTNLLAMNRVALSAPEFAQRMVLPELASVAATAACLWIFYWHRGRRGVDRYEPPAAPRPADPVLFWTCAAACVIFVAGVVAGLELAVVSPVCAAVVVVVFVVRKRDSLRWGLLPWRLLVFVTGLFFVVQTISDHGLAGIMHAVIGDSDGPGGVFRAAGTGAGLSNLLNNLPAYTAGEAVVPTANHDQLLGLLIGTNVGPIVTPWASLATLLWYERCRSAGVQVAWPRFLRTGLVAALACLAAATGALVLTG